MWPCWGWKPDPGPCPVDDAPHTTCTSPDYAARQPLTRRVGVQAGTSVSVPVRVPVAAQYATRLVASFSTTSYRRNVEGKALGIQRR
jgi:hypothetical protein